MKSFSGKHAVICVALATIFFIGALFFVMKSFRSSPALPSEITTSDYVEHENVALGFAIERNKILADVTENSSGATFSMQGDRPSLSVSISESSFNKTAEWLNQQDIGSTSKIGYQTLFCLDDLQTVVSARCVVVEYVVADSADDKPILGKVVSLVAIANGQLYKVSFPNQFPADAVPQIDQGTLRALGSFRVFEVSR